MSTTGEGDGGAKSPDDVITPSQSRVRFSRPWRGSEYATDYEEAFQFVRSQRYHGHPTRLRQAVRHVYGDDYTNTEYQRIRRFINRTGWLRATTEQGFTQVEPTLEVFGLESAVSKSQKRKTESGSGVTFDKLEETGATTETESNETTHSAYPKDRVNRLREKFVRLDGYDGHTDHREDVFRELVQYRENTADKYTLLKRRITEEYLALPYRTRFNDRERAESSQSRFRTALHNASEDFRMATAVTLTPDPKRFESHVEATDAITKQVNNLNSYLKYQTGGFEAVPVFDFQRNGLPHIHLVLFGVRIVEDESNNETGEPTVSEAQIREYWDSNADMGKQVAVQPARRRNDEWLLHNDDKKVSLRHYLGKRIRELIELAELDESELWQKVESGDIELWRHALFWATGKQYVSCSDSLKESDDGDGDDLPYAPAWEYVGTMKFDQIPEHVLDRTTVCRRSTFADRPPPATATATESRSGTEAAVD